MRKRAKGVAPMPHCHRKTKHEIKRELNDFLNGGNYRAKIGRHVRDTGTTDTNTASLLKTTPGVLGNIDLSSFGMSKRITSSVVKPVTVMAKRKGRLVYPDRSAADKVLNEHYNVARALVGERKLSPSEREAMLLKAMDLKASEQPLARFNAATVKLKR